MNPDQPYSMYNCIGIHTSAYDTFACRVPCAHDETWLRAFCFVADQIINNLQPPTVLDTGCASGLLVEAQSQYGVEAWGIGASQEAIQNLPPEIQPYCSTNSMTNCSLR
jgi:hypothetical protein